MRRYLTIGIDQDGAVEILHGADKSASEHRDEFHRLAADKQSDFAEVQVIDLSKAVVKRKRFGSTKRTVARKVKPGDPREKTAKPSKKAARKAAKSQSRKAAADEGNFPESQDDPILA